MKKIKIYLALICIGVLFSLSGCTKKASLKSCDELEADANAAATAFGMNPTQQTCEDFYDAIQDLYDGCDRVPASVRASYDVWLSSIDCSIYP